MTDLLSLMAPETPPTWRNGLAIPHKPYVPAKSNDLQFFAHDYRDHKKGGRWFRYNARDSIWECLDPYDQTGVNKCAETPPAVDEYGRLA